MRATRHLLPLALAPAGLAGCVRVQSALDPAGPHAERVADLHWVMTAGGAAIFLFVIVLAIAALFRRGREHDPGNERFVLGLGVVFPVVVLTALLTYGLGIARDLVGAGPPALRVRVTGEQWWWRVDYLDAEGRSRLASANEIRVPVGMPVEFLLDTADVIHSFWVPSLAGKLDMIPGRTNRIVFSADKPGVYRGQCAEYCGGQHALMAFTVVALDKAEFDAWWAREAGDAVAPTTDEARRGADLFMTQGCGDCHAVRGTRADGRLGPDLTHVGSRTTIAAGTFPRNVGTLAGWIASAQHLKPGNRMPSFDRLSGPDLRAIAGYLEGLK